MVRAVAIATSPLFLTEQAGGQSVDNSIEWLYKNWTSGLISRHFWIFCDTSTKFGTVKGSHYSQI